MDDSELSMRFPGLQRLEKAPSLGTVAGVGTALFGGTDYDEETNTLVKQRCACVLGIPILVLGAYRVVDRPQGYLFLGRVPLSGGAKGFNAVIVSLVLALTGYGAWYKYTTTPAYIAGQALAEADRLAASGEVGRAASLYSEVAVSGTEYAAQARARVPALVAGLVPQTAADQAAEVLRAAVSLRQRPDGGPGLEGLFDRGQELAAAHAEADARGALRIVDAVAPLAPDAGRLAAVRRPLLEQIVAQNPEDPKPASELAVVYESEGKLGQCEALLKPHAERLGDREGARILGRLLAAQGQFEQAYAVLQPYTDIRLQRLHAAEKAFKEAIASVQAQLVEQVKSGQAPGFDYSRFQRAGEQGQMEMFLAYANPRLAADPAIRAAQEAMARESVVVPVALDLGMVRLQRARALADSAARRQELEAAESLFLAVRGQAGELDQFRVNLAQVYYWLGKHQEGKKLFDEVLAARRGQTASVIEIAGLLREVGERSAARALIEEAYEKETDRRLKYQAAEARAVMPLDVEDQITWLSRGDPADAVCQAHLSAARGQQALRKGKDDEAVAHLRQAVAAYDRQPEGAAVLNNSAGTCRTLYTLTGDRRDYDQVLTRYEKALALEPSHAVVLGNTARTQVESGLWDVIGGAIDLGALRLPGGASLLGYLYCDEAGRQRYADQVRTNPKVARARANYERGLILAPKNANAYSALGSLAALAGDREALQRLLQALEAVELDLADGKRTTLEYYAGTKDAEHKASLAASVQRYEAIVNATRPKGGPTFALAAVTLAGFWMSGHELGVPADAVAVVRLTEEAHAAAPSQATYRALQEALSFRLVQTASRVDAAFAEAVTRCQRAVSMQLLLIALLAERPARWAALANDPDAQRLLQLVLEYDARLPDHAAPWTWAFLNVAERDEAGAVGRRVLEDQAGELSRAIALRLSPLDLGTALQMCWQCELAGKPADGQAILKRLSEQGVPLPIEVK